MRILVACEFSGTVREAFNARAGCHALSCDLLPAADGRVDYHYQGDVRDILDDGWDILIGFPDCTYLTNSAAWAFKDGPYHQHVKPGTLTGAARRKAREEAIAFFLLLWNSPIPKIALENPIGSLSRVVPWTQIIQPHQFGGDASKSTCLWLKGLPPLVPTKHVAPRMVNGRPRWANQTDSGQNRLSPSDDRASIRSITYAGVAAAMADQWT